MNLFRVMEISGSALLAERQRAEVVTSNLANAETTNAAGGPYKRMHVVFSAQPMAQPGFGATLASFTDMHAAGVRVTQVVEDGAAAVRRFEPGHPDADAEGYVAYSSSQVDKRRVGQLALAIQVAFQEMGVFQDSNTHVPLQDTDDMPFQKVQIIENVDRTQQMQRFVQPMSGILSNTAPSEAVKDIQRELEKALGPEIQKHYVEMRTTREGLVVSLREIGFFESGSATLRPSSQNSIDRLVAVLRNRPEMLRIEGHTDNVPIHTSRFASNWELSTARATELIRGFIDRYHLSPERLAAAGYGEHHPVASNDTSEGRARNRRVDIVILAPPVSYLPSPKLKP